jgi:hypothetical protein
MTLTVSPTKADLVGADEKVIQAAVDLVARRGGGTVRILPGTYRLRNSIFLQSRVRLVGSGADSVLIKEPSATTKLTADFDSYDQVITLADPRGFHVGDGVCLRARDPRYHKPIVLKRTLVARLAGDGFQLDRALGENLWLVGEPTAATLFPLLTGEKIADVVIEDVTLDGNKANNDLLDGDYSGCIFLQDCKRMMIRRVIARNQNGDGISWQTCHDVIVEGCHSHDHAELGLHPGTGSQRPLIRDNRVERSEDGIYFCWGVRFGLAERNTITDCRRHGISIGHRDTDNLIRENTIVRSGKVGVLFRVDEEGRSFAPHRNRLEGNRIVDSGPEDGVGVDVRGEPESIAITRNEVRETRAPLRRTGIRIGAQARHVTLCDNRIEGFARAVADLARG